MDSTLCGIAASIYIMGFFSKLVFICIQGVLSPVFADKQMQGSDSPFSLDMQSKEL